MVEHKITGVASINPRITEKQAASLPLLPASITMDPAGIDLFHAILQIVFAHLYSPYRLPQKTVSPELPSLKAVKENRTAALAFLQAGRSHDAKGMARVTINVGDAPHPQTQYTLIHRDKAIPLVIHINPVEELKRCVTVQMPTGISVGLDFGTIKVPPPPAQV